MTMTIQMRMRNGIKHNVTVTKNDDGSTTIFDFQGNTLYSSNTNSNGFFDTALDISGKIWNFPNTLLGVAYGGLGYLIGNIGYGIDQITGALGYNTNLVYARPTISFGNNAIQFHNNPLTTSAITLGNTISYGSDTLPENRNVPFVGTPNNHTVGKEELNHTIQGQILGLGYLPAHLVGGIISVFSSPHPDLYYNVDPWHQNNFMETGPMQNEVF